MKAMQFQGYGRRVRLLSVDIPQPLPGPTQLLVEVAATAINPIDWKLRSGLLGWLPRWRLSSVPCLDFAGTVVATGPSVALFRPGERVFGMLPARASGAAAEYVVVDQDLIARIPAGVDVQATAGMPLAGLTALQGLRDDGQLKAEQRLLVIGASGGVGHFAVQIGKSFGAHVTGLCSTRHLDLVRSLGADAAIDYTRGIPDGGIEPFDVIFDTVVSLPWQKWRRLLSAGGIYVSLLPTLDRVWNALLFRLTSTQRIRFTLARPNGQDMQFLGRLAQEGRLRTVVDSIFALNQLGAAFEKSRSGRAQGKIMVVVNDTLY